MTTAAEARPARPAKGLPLTVLLLEDLPDDAELLLLELRRSGFEPRARRVDTEADFIAALEAGYAPGEPWDLVLGDYRLPDFNGLRALALLRERNPDLPFILVSGTVGEEVAVEAMKEGAADYLLKGRLTRLSHAVRHALDENRLRLEKRAAEHAVRDSERRFRALIENSAEGIGVTSRHGRLTYLSPACARLLGYTPEQLLGGNPFDFVHPDDRALVKAALRDVLRHPGQWREAEYRLRHASGQWRTIHTSITNLLADPSVAGLVFNYHDVTVRRANEEALRESEQRYRGLFEDSPIALWEEDFSLVRQRLEALRQSGVADLPAYLAAHPEFVAECARLIRILDVNQTAVKRYRAHSRAELIAHVDQIFGPATDPDFAAELVSIAGGQTDFRWEGANRTLAGDAMQVSLSWSALPGHEHDLARVIVSTVDITERVQAEAHLKQRLAELEAVNHVSAALREAANLDEMLPVLVREAVAVLGGFAGGVWLYDPGGDRLSIAYSQGWQGAAPGPFRPGEDIAGLVFSSGEPYRAREMKADARIPPEVREDIPPGLGGVLVPIRASDERIGVLAVNALLPREFSPDDVHLLTTLADMAGNAIQRTRLHQQTEQQLSRMTALRSVDQAISASLDLRMTLNVLLDQATLQLGADAADVLLLNPNRQLLEFFVGRGHQTAEAERLRMRLGDGRAGRVAYHQRPLRVSDLRLESGRDPAAALVAAEGYVAYAALPLLAKGLIKGVLEVYHRRPLETGQDWMDFLEALAGQAAIAIDNAALFDGLQRSNLELTLAYDATIAGWSRALDMRDRQAEGHTQRETELAVRLAEAVGVPASELVHVRRGALLHDIGNMVVPTEILIKPGPLSADEWALVRQHPQSAFDLLTPIPFLRPALDIPYSHHERWDGSGYPRGLQGEAIPQAARVFAVVDVWDALRSDRPYRPAWPEAQVRDYLREQAGRLFDPHVVAAFLRLVEET